MPLTCTEKATTMQHVVRIVMCQPDDSPIEKCFCDMACEDPADIFGMDEDAIQALSCHEIQAGDATQTVTHHSLLPGHQGYVRAFVYWLEYLQQNEPDHPVHTEQWTSLTQGDFDQFWIGPNFKC